MRNRATPNPAAWLLGLLCLSLAGVLQAASFEGRIVKSDGQVSVTSARGEAIDLDAAGNVVRETQTIATGPDGMAVVRFNNGSITVLDPDSRLQVKTPNWFVHLAGKAFFAFKKIVGAADERRVQNTVALIGIRGTEFISYEADQTALALDEGQLNVQTLGNAFQVSEDGAQSEAAEFLLDEKQLVTFDGGAAAITAFTPAVLADFAAFRVFGGDLLGDFSLDFSADQTAAVETPQPAAAAAATAEEQAQKQPEEATAEPEQDEGPSGPGLYVGLGGGLSQSDSDQAQLQSELTAAGNATGISVNFDEESQAGKVFVGYYFTNNFGAEVGYSDLGKFDSTISATPSNAQQFTSDVTRLHPVSASGVYAAGVLRLNLFLFSIVGKAGVYVWEGQVEAAVNGSTVNADKDGADPMVALGIDLPILPIRVEAERYELDGDAVNVLSANLVFQF